MRSNLASFKKNVFKVRRQLIIDMFVHETRYMKFKQIICMKYTIISINIVKFRKFVAIKYTQNNFIALLLDFIQQYSISSMPSE